MFLNVLKRTGKNSRDDKKASIFGHPRSPLAGGSPVKKPYLQGFLIPALMCRKLLAKGCHCRELEFTKIHGFKGVSLEKCPNWVRANPEKCPLP